MNSYVAEREPGQSEGWTDFALVSERRFLVQDSIEAHEYVNSYSDSEDGFKTSAQHWYVLGSTLIKVWALTGTELWGTDGEQFSMHLEVQNSFQPAGYSNPEYGYSLAHPPGWTTDADDDTDYGATDPTGILSVWVRVSPGLGYSEVFDYGTAFPEIGDTVSRGLVFTGRPNPSYRIDYVWVGEGGSRWRVAHLTTLGRGNAIVVSAFLAESDWTEFELLVGRVFARVTVAPD